MKSMTQLQFIYSAQQRCPGKFSTEALRWLFRVFESSGVIHDEKDLFVDKESQQNRHEYVRSLLSDYNEESYEDFARERNLDFENEEEFKASAKTFLQTDWSELIGFTKRKTIVYYMMP